MSDPLMENERLRVLLHKVRHACTIHRKMGENTESEIRGLRRKIEAVKHSFGIYLRHYKNPEEAEISEAALKNVEKLLSSM